MAFLYYCPLCGQRDAAQMGAPCSACRETARQVREQHRLPEPGDCFYCKGFFQELTTDHVVPVVRGGPELPRNRVPACLPCNLSKSDRTPSEWCPDNEEAMKIESEVRNILPRMRHGKIIGDQSRMYFQVFSICTSFANTVRDQSNELAKIPGSDSMRRKLMSIWKRLDDLRVHLIDHPAVLKARDLGDDG